MMATLETTRKKNIWQHHQGAKEHSDHLWKKKEKHRLCLRHREGGSGGQHLGVGGTRVATPNNSHWSRPCIILGLKDSGTREGTYIRYH